MVHHIGVDVAKAFLAVFDGRRSFEIPNTPSGMAAWLKGIGGTARIAMESTGRYGELLARLAYEAGHEVFVLPPSWVRHHRLSAGGRAKTDKADARAIQKFIAEPPRALAPWRPMDEALEKIVQLKRDRDAAVKTLAAFRMRGAVQGRPEAVVQALKEHIAALDQQLEAEMSQRPEAALLQSVPGVGLQTAAAVLPILQHRQFRSADQLAAFAGLDPAPCESGTFKGRRRISKRGDARLRTALYLAAVSACRSAAFKGIYQKLKEKLKPKQALAALARRISRILLAIYKTKQPFNPERVALKL